MTLAATTVWEIRTDGAATNGGGYKSDAGTTDYSQQAAAQLALSDAACTTGGAIVTSATGGFTAAMVGNICYISGTNFTTGWYEIVGYTDTNTITVDRDPTTGSNGSSGTLNVGGALNGIGTLGLVLSTAAQSVAGMKAYVREGTYTLSTTSVNVDGGPLDLDANQQDGKYFMLKGYDAAESRDSFSGTKPIIDCNGNAPASVVELKGGLNNFHVIAFLELDGDSQNTIGIAGNAPTQDYAQDCYVHDCDNGSTGALRVLTTYKCRASNGSWGFYQCYSFYCMSDGNSDTGFGNAGSAYNCIAYNNTNDGFNLYYGTCAGCIAYGNGSDGFLSSYGCRFINCIAYSHSGGYSFNTKAWDELINCASGSTGSGRTNATPFIDDGAITLTGDPFINAATLDFNINNTAGAGAALRAVTITMP